MGGDPGIGKSTLMLQAAKQLCADASVLYVSGEESEGQLKMRAGRIGAEGDNLYILCETNIDSVLEALATLKPRAAIIDSIQTVYTDQSNSIPGSITQIRECCIRLMRYAKENGTAIFLVGHVTKEGAIAGPRVLEHMVDCVLYFEGERHQSYRILRAVKNRFGSTNEIGVFEMSDSGLKEVLNPSMMLLSGRPEGAPGSAVVCSMEGTRPILAEIQALVSPTGFGVPRRMASGIDYNRAVMLLAVAEKRLGIQMQNHDAYINVIGGIKIVETAVDLAMLLAVISAYKNIPLPSTLVAVGEVGLTGEVRAVSFAEKRINEAAKLGFKQFILPSDNIKNIKKPQDMRLIGVRTLSDALKAVNEICGKVAQDE